MRGGKRRSGVHPAVCAALLLASAVLATMGVHAAERRAPTLAVPVLQTEAAGEAPEAGAELRGVWVPYMSLDLRGGDGSAETFREMFDRIVETSKDRGMNALFVQVRPFGDAFYESEIFPWSSLLTGTQGIHPGYDPLAYMVEAAHAAGMELHAWVNPLRIQQGSTPEALAQSNPYQRWKRDPEKAGWTVDLPDGKYYNPAYPEVRELIAAGVREIAARYAVDGVHFDDYFYPTEDPSFDEAAYHAYCAEAGDAALPLADWRRQNVNLLVEACHAAVHEASPGAVFGISPQANLQNDWDMGADIAAWCAQGSVDYLCPQLYVSLEHPTLPFAEAAAQWAELTSGSGVTLYFGLAAYKAGSGADGGTWQDRSDILAQQISLGRESGCEGFLFYSWESLVSAQAEEEVANAAKLLD